MSTSRPKLGSSSSAPRVSLGTLADARLRKPADTWSTLGSLRRRLTVTLVRPFPATEAGTTPGYTGLRMLRRSGGVAIAAVCASVGSSCGSSPPAPTTASQVIARVGSDTITLAQFNVRYQSAYTSIVQGGGGHPPSAAVTALRARILGGLILDTVIREEATRLGLAATTQEVAAEVAADARQAGGTTALQTELAGAGGSIAQLQDEITANLNEQRVEDVFAQQRGALVEQILVKGANFATTAKTYSDDSGTKGTASKGGDLGVLSAAQLKTYNPAFAAAVESLAVGAYTKAPVHDAGGYDIVMVYSKTAKGWGVRHILIYAGNPYNVTDRPDWFTEGLFTAVDQLCTANNIQVSLTNAGGNPCPSPSPSPSPASPSPHATATAKPPG